MDLSVVIVNWNTRELLPACLDSVFETIGPDITLEVWLVDNASSDGSAGLVKERYPEVKLIESRENLGFAGGNNLALERMHGRYALLLNTDAQLTPGAVQAMYDFLEATPKAAMVCGQLLNPNGSKQNSIANFPTLPSLLFNETLLRLLAPRRYPSKRREYKKPLEIDSCIGASMMVRKAAMDQCGLLDTGYFFFMEETDWARTMKQAGWQVWFTPKAQTIHAQGRSVGHGAASRKLFFASRYRYFKKWHPQTWPIFHGLAFGRLVVNALLALIGTVFTLGLEKGTRLRLQKYLILLGWHLRSCRG